MRRSIFRRISALLLFTLLAHGEPIEYPSRNSLPRNSELLQRGDTNWTTQAFQTHCDNVNYLDNTDCCTKESGPGWKSCNGAGDATFTSSSIICYNLDAGHDCCVDDSVCDEGLGCCGDTCCQNTTSITVCGDGCISKEGRGCVVEYGTGTCAHGVQQGTTTLDSFTSSATAYGTGDPSSADTIPTKSSAASTNNTTQKSSGLSSGAIIGIAVSVGGTIISVLFGIGFKIWKYNKQKKRQEMIDAQERADRRKSIQSSPLTPQPTWPQQPGTNGVYPGYK
ncbi:hypothetical protein P154DRAFT_525709 [Amniculicola lignicola CBS 123094]|uniref:Mid2 domain-containing protein n=1 Tax=Amniculicola lignicola CBS 123094 TaxID=1392246 RepID=A0A6A5W359_9PLEO|nr:hypothetical protein P154DRAFT_525709 [Amniculicola lignicola CBS 123094]